MFVFKTSMMITPINNLNINFHNINKTNPLFANRRQSSSVSFKGKDVIDVSVFANTVNLYNMIEKNHFKEAYEYIDKLKKDFYPNYVDPNTGMPILLKLAEKQRKIYGRESKKESYYIKEIMVKVLEHKIFNTNQQFELKDKKGNTYSTTYLEEAINNRDTDLASMIDTYRGGIDDPFNDNYQTLILNAKKTGNSFLSKTIARIALYEINQRQTDETEEAEETEEAKAKEKDKEKDEKEEQEEWLAKTLYEVKDKDEIPDSLDKIGGVENAKKEIERYIIKPWKEDIRKRLKENHISMPNGFLMYGPPGCGKTFVTQIISKQTGYPMHRITTSDIGSHYVADVSRRLKLIFDGLERRYKEDKIPRIAFLDEIDDMGISRDSTTSSGKKEDLISLLMQINNAGNRGIIVIGATNYPQGVDKALLRSGRFDKKIELTLPEKEERIEILKKLIEDKPIAKNLLGNLDELAEKTDGKSPADLAKYVNDCAGYAITYTDKDAITKEDFFKAMEESELSEKRNKIGFSK